MVTTTSIDVGTIQRLRVTIRGVVQGVGFRPFVYRMAKGLSLTAWVQNATTGVGIEVEGSPRRLKEFLLKLQSEKPPHAFTQTLEPVFLDSVGYEVFEIRHSEESGEKTALILPDLATCSECVREIFDPTNRRFRYPFSNCTHCGPRYSIIEALPYDRARTTMKSFRMCEECRTEYEDPADRRFHAQPNACSRCGPHLELWEPTGKAVASYDEALRAAGEAICRGAIVAVKGLGGFHLLVDARDEAAVVRLRERKVREEKPFALMYPNVEWVRAHCEVGTLEERLLLSSESPIVLVRRKRKSDLGFESVTASAAPGNPCLGVMLPYTPLHHLLLADLGFPVVATSGNRSDEPICTDEREALARLRGIADYFLVHNRPIARHVDDSIVRVVLDRELVLRRARGYAPLPVHLKKLAPAILAVGAHLKNTVAIAAGNEVFISQHIGDLETLPAVEAFQQVLEDLPRLYDWKPSAVASDGHPDYFSTQYARKLGVPAVDVQHHYAHVLACMAENELESPVLGVAWDGTGYGLDGTIWGGEFLRVTETSFERVAYLRPFRLPGGDKAVREPRRAALGLLYEAFGDEVFANRRLAPIRAFSARELAALRTMLEKGLNSPLTSSAGRLFDGIASSLSLRQQARFEGQAAMELEFASEAAETDAVYPFVVEGRIVDWEPCVRAIIGELQSEVPVARIAARFHNTLAEIIVAVSRRIGEKKIILTGGCFQNRYLTETSVQRLRAAGFQPYWHQRVPPNDGGVALGQIVAASRYLQEQGNVPRNPRKDHEHTRR
jgi:[NiFe] hydrogenase maturation protein HypF